MFTNPYILVLVVALSVGYTVTEKIKAPVTKVAHVVKVAAVKAGHATVTLATFGQR
jgi:hypothetical protein